MALRTKERQGRPSSHSITLTSRQWRALEVICDTFVPGDGLPAASELGAPEAFVRVLEHNPRRADRRAIGALLAAWDSRLLGLVSGVGFRRFSQLSHPRREQALLSWCDSRLWPRRAAFQALRRAAVLMYYLVPGEEEPNPVWEAMGYPGVLGRMPGRPPKQIEPLEIAQDCTLDCDVCVVGSGAGGGTAAGVLAAAGLDVIVLEAGDYLDDGDFDGAELDGYRRMYLDHGATATFDQGMGLLAGACLGGGTTVNFSTSFRTPGDVREEWARHGVPAFASDEYGASLDAVCARLGVTEDRSEPSARDVLMQRGLEALGWHVGVMPRNVGPACDQGKICGHCGYGCPLGAKQSTVKTWLADAHRAGARILVLTRAMRVLVERGRARGVEARTAGGQRVTVRSRAVVVAGGAIQSPALLRRSGLSNLNIGKHLRVHPTTGLAGIFDEEVRPWEGTLQAIYSDQHRDLRGGYGVKYESAALHPSVLGTFIPWRGARAHAEIMRSLRHIVPIPVIVRDRGGGTVNVDRRGEPVVRYRLSRFDLRHLRVGFEGAARILEAAGARRIVSAHARGVGYEPGRGSSVEDFCRRADAAGWRRGQCVMYSAHIMGSVRMGGSPKISATNPEGETWEVSRLYVWDGSSFPTASGVNPMVSIEAIAHMGASRLAAQL
jgi:long-chain-alcohol oxidase